MTNIKSEEEIKELMKKSLCDVVESALKDCPYEKGSNQECDWIANIFCAGIAALINKRCKPEIHSTMLQSIMNAIIKLLDFFNKTDEEEND